MFATHPAALGEALAIVYQAIAAFLIKKAGQPKAQWGTITLVQRFGSALNPDVHFHMLIPDGLFLTTDPPYFRAAAAAALQELVQRISKRTGQLERKGWLVRDAESTYLDSHLAKSFYQLPH